MPSIQQRVEEAVAAVRSGWLAAETLAAGTPPTETLAVDTPAADTQVTPAPEAILVTGSGLGSILKSVSPIVFEMSYNDIPHLPASRIAGHTGRLVIGHYGNEQGTKIVVLDGRVHGYEGHDPLTQVLPLLIANELCGGARLAVLTNAVGAINEHFAVGELMLIKDHINFSGQSLVELNSDSDFGGTNLDMSFVYTPKYRQLLVERFAQGMVLHEGTYLGVKGAMFETPAEIRAFRTWGADVVGMSTVHEATAASRLGIDLVGISVITNMAAGIEAKQLTHQEVLDNTKGAASQLGQLLHAVFTAL
ncbi:MAG: purine-nucleoside phosphorylase [Coriobacteriia bacterium]|nr:purine-nucleoside phosphorylase [Coriobacteriia bacterium]